MTIVEVRGWEYVKGLPGAKNMSKNKSDCVGISSSFSRAQSIPSIENFSAPFDNLYLISERVKNSTQKPSAEKKPPEQTLTPSLPPIINVSPISEIVYPQTGNTLTALNLPERNNPPVVMTTPHPCTLRCNKFSEVIITDYNVQPKLKAHTGFLRKSVVLCPSLYIYPDVLRRNDPM